MHAYTHHGRGVSLSLVQTVYYLVHVRPHLDHGGFIEKLRI